MLQVPQLLVHVQHQVLAPLREILERDLAAQFSVGRTATAQRIAAGTEWVIVHAHVRILARPLQREKPREDHRVALGGHAAEVVESDVARDSSRQEPLSSVEDPARPFTCGPGDVFIVRAFSPGEHGHGATLFRVRSNLIAFHTAVLLLIHHDEARTCGTSDTHV